MNDMPKRLCRTCGVVLSCAALLAAPACGEEQPRVERERIRGVQADGAASSAQPARSVLDAVPPRPVDPEVAESLQQARALSRAFQYAAQNIEPSVVHIIQQRQVRIMRNLFDVGERRLAPTGTGSGFVVTPDGYVVTNHHVIAGAERVLVKLNDGREYPGTIVGTDPATDLGLVKIEADNLVPARFGDSEALEVGEWVLAVGSPFGVFNNTVTAGIVSAKGRRGLAGPADRFEDFIQTDAAINPGNSGGPLVNLEGEVVGINSQIATRTGGSVGIGFAIPSAIAVFVVDSLINTGRVERGFLGVEGPVEGQAAPTPQQIALYERAGAELGQGALITNVIPGGPADQAGLEPGDVVLSFNGRSTPDYPRFRNTVAFTPPGTRAAMEIMRNGVRQQLEVVVSDSRRGQALLPGGSAFPRYGFRVSTLPREAARQLGNIAGVVVREVEQLGPAAQVDLRINDIIVHVNGTAVPDTQAFDRAIRSIPEGESIRVGVLRPATWERGFLDIPPWE
jgi:serine protease Do